MAHEFDDLKKRWAPTLNESRAFYNQPHPALSSCLLLLLYILDIVSTLNTYSKSEENNTYEGYVLLWVTQDWRRFWLDGSCSWFQSDSWWPIRPYGGYPINNHYSFRHVVDKDDLKKKSMISFIPVRHDSLQKDAGTATNLTNEANIWYLNACRWGPVVCLFVCFPFCLAHSLPFAVETCRWLKAKTTTTIVSPLQPTLTWTVYNQQVGSGSNLRRCPGKSQISPLLPKLRTHFVLKAMGIFMNSIISFLFFSKCHSLMDGDKKLQQMLCALIYSRYHLHRIVWLVIQQLLHAPSCRIVDVWRERTLEIIFLLRNWYQGILWNMNYTLHMKLQQQFEQAERFVVNDEKSLRFLYLDSVLKIRSRHFQTCCVMLFFATERHGTCIRLFWNLLQGFSSQSNAFLRYTINCVTSVNALMTEFYSRFLDGDGVSAPFQIIIPCNFLLV